MDPHTKLLGDAEAAVEEVFSDTSVSPERILRSLEDLSSNIDFKVAAVKRELRRPVRHHYVRSADGWGVADDIGVLADGLTKGEAAGFARILDGGDEDGLWGDDGLIGRRSPRRLRNLGELRAKCGPAKKVEK